MFHKSVELDLWEMTAFCLALHGSRQVITKAVTSLPVHWLMAAAGLWAQLSRGHRVSLNFRSIASLIKTKLTRNKYFPRHVTCPRMSVAHSLHWFALIPDAIKVLDLLRPKKSFYSWFTPPSTSSWWTLCHIYILLCLLHVLPYLLPSRVPATYRPQVRECSFDQPHRG